MKPTKGFSKKAAKALNKKNKSATSKVYGKTVMKDVGGGKSIGYDNTTKTKLPKLKIKSTKGGGSPQARRSQRKAR